ncbi:hypothetical protein CONCODRAFT_2294 [Conidiobolus coronatus NRRL 28638]|uniref:Prolyl 4-hydroxylase alpha subunit domain-containing protein n=1 Tax=Conidiobolus coronatus (strain ATCC 28846 / CBS 209.66 / NRRL 28638) TaxID=796925 RepID=A0A137PIB8_CONC2|nr:hypothetical protein CONCODRAFT_2294 [Conidiobolus coronatus NRRL 28638]|eukprot:KXN74729.1 hypothetical protein CONCODRAFT_2294 [Conidiobolus coronatus NRRL 28638]
MSLTEDQINQFLTNGYLVLDSFLDKIELEEFKEECDNILQYIKHKNLDVIRDLGCIIEPWIIYFTKLIDQSTLQSYNNYKVDINDFENLRAWGSEFNLVEFIKKRIINLVKGLFLNVNDSCKEVYLFNEQYIVKPSDIATKFQLHKDSEHLPNYCKKVFNLAVWINLDAINESSGYFNFASLNNPQAITQLKLPPGSIVLIHSECPHYSDPNNSNSLRRAYMLQLTQKPLYYEENDNLNELISMGVKIKF